MQMYKEQVGTIEFSMDGEQWVATLHFAGECHPPIELGRVLFSVVAYDDSMEIFDSLIRSAAQRIISEALADEGFDEDKAKVILGQRIFGKTKDIH